MKTKRKRLIAIYRDSGKTRSKRICEAWVAACKLKRIEHFVQEGIGFRKDDRARGDIAIFYGRRAGLLNVYNAYREQAKAIYIDLGYWNRKPGTDRFSGYHKVCVNAAHATDYFRVGHPRDRLDEMGVNIKPWRGRGDHIIVAGMSDKSAQHNGYKPEEWERWAVAELRQHTDRPIWYRPKPSWHGAKPIEGATHHREGTDITPHLNNAWAVVTHHSNAAVDAMVEGIPTYCEDGLASTMSMASLANIEQNIEPPDREGFLADVAYTQWSVAEMESGACWDYLLGEGLV